jgi:hypothetical protein
MHASKPSLKHATARLMLAAVVGHDAGGKLTRSHITQCRTSCRSMLAERADLELSMLRPTSRPPLTSSTRSSKDRGTITLQARARRRSSKLRARTILNITPKAIASCGPRSAVCRSFDEMERIRELERAFGRTTVSIALLIADIRDDWFSIFLHSRLLNGTVVSL